MSIFIIAIPVLFLYVTGYRIGKGYSLVTTGGIYIHPWNIRGDVYINNKPISQTTFLQKDHLIQSLMPNTYTIELARDGYSSWKKNVSVHKQIVTEISPFLITKNPETADIPKTITDPKQPKSKGVANPLFKKIELLFLPTDPSEAILVDGAPPITKDGELKEDYIVYRKMALWKQKNIIYAEWTGEPDYIPSYFCESELRTSCKTTITVIPNAKNITRFEFYPGRDDIMIAALPDGLYATELDTRSTQNSARIFEGKNLDFRIKGGDILYAKKNAETFVEITVE